ncbi:MAG: sulfur transferase domain-containing protein [Nevskia sp.]
MTPENKPFSLSPVIVPNRQQPSPTLVTGGAPDVAALQAAAAAGVQYVFDLRPASEWSYDEASTVAGLGMRFLHLPIAGAQDFTPETVRAFDALLAQAGAAPTLLHCASGNRVGALMALRAAWLRKVPVDEAMAIGRAHGLTRMEPVVQGLLSA